MAEPTTMPVGRAVNLRVGFASNPLGVDATDPALGWLLPSSFRQQSAYQIRAATRLPDLSSGSPDLWDSGKIVSRDSQQVRYAGQPLSAAQRVFWQVRTWDAADVASEWSEPATWTRGLLEDADWKPARWITAWQSCLDPNDLANPDGVAGLNPRPVGIDCARISEKNLLRRHVPAQSIRLRKKLVVQPGLTRALLFSTGLAHYEATINGTPVSDRLLTPGWSNYRKTTFYDTTDVTALLARAGEHRIELLLGNGMYSIYYSAHRYVKFVNTFGAQKALALLWLEYTDGRVEKIGTDPSWRSAVAPLTYSNVYGGEDYDQRLEAISDESDAIAAPAPGGILRGCSASAPPVRAIETLKPIQAIPHSPVTTIYDLGQNASIMPRLIAGGPAGSSVSIHPAELLDADGNLDRKSCVQDRGGPAFWEYTFDGRPPETLFPKFFYQGGRYLQVDRVPSPTTGELPVIQSLEGVVVHSSAEPAGTFECSNDLFNRIYALVRWAQRSNMMHVMTDCPAREKLGWLEQLHLNGPSLRYNFRLDRFYRKVIADMADAQFDDGFVPNIAPEFFSADADLKRGPFRCSIEWGSSFILAAWQQYLFHADAEVLATHYPAMVRYFDFLTSLAKDDLIATGLGDWYDLGPKAPWGSQLTPPAFTGSAIYMEDALALARIARLLQREEDAARFDRQAKRTRDAINARFRDDATGAYTRGFPYPTGSQCATAMALALNIAPDNDRVGLAEALVDDIRKNHNGLTAGDVGYRYVLRALADAGRSDVIFDLNTNPDRPGYAMQLARGATALTEKWDASVGDFGSQNHFMLGQINEWFFHDLAGIAPDPQSPGFRHVIVRPQPCGDITSVNATYAGPYGTIAVAWKRANAGVEASVTIPPGSTATIILPGKADPIELDAGRHQIGA